MAGSFDIFRKYQRSLLVAVAILAMLAFFVLPPFLQMGSNASYEDPVAVSWAGGSLRESELERAVAMQSVVNRFLVQSAAAAGKDPSRISLFPENEEAVVRTMLLARQARDNGVVVSDRAVNDYLSQLTSDMVKPQQLDAIIAGLRVGPQGVSQTDLFSALRTERAAWASLIMAQAAFSGDPPGWRWEAFRRLEQAAVVEAVPVEVRGLADEVPSPSEPVMRAFFERFKERLPEPASREPGFREPHRVEAEYLVANLKKVEETVKGEVTDEAIAQFYEKNKERMFRADETKPEQKPDATPDQNVKPESKPDQESDRKSDQKPVQEKKPGPESKSDAAKSDAAKSDAAKSDAAKPDAAKPEPENKPAPSASPAATGPQPTKPESDPPAAPKPAPPAAASGTGGPDAGRADAGRIEREAKRVDTDAAASPAGGTAKADAKQADEKETGKQPAGGDTQAKQKEEASAFEPLEKVKERIREQLVRERAEKKIDAIFTAAAGDVTGYAEDLAVWKARNDGRSAEPRRPDVAAIAKVQGLESGRTGMVSALDASEIEGIGRSFEFTPDPGSRFGVRQQSWLEMMFGRGSLLLRPVTSRDIDGNRYLSWKSEDRPEYTPNFEEARDGVEKAWRIVEARGVAMRKAKEIAKKAEADKATLEAAVAGRTDVKATQVGPFTFLTQGTAPIGAAPVLSSPKGLDMPGEEFMKAVFGLAPGGVAVAFNEPETVCYCIRLVSYEPSEEVLRQRFLDDREDQSRLAMVSQRQYQRQFGEWVEGLDKKYAVEWKRPPRIARGE